MAVVLKLVRSATELSLNAASGGGLRHVDWIPQVAVPIEGRDPLPVTETFDLWAERDTDDNLAATLQGLDEMRVWADRYMRDPNTEYPVWFHAKMSGETGERRALARSIDAAWATPQVEATGPPVSHKARLRVTIEREPWWERPTARAFGEGSEASGASLVYDYTGGASPHDIVGDLPARIQCNFFLSDATGAPVGRVWIGVRSANKHGTLANFLNIWELEDPDAVLGTDATRATDATASPGGAGNTKVTVTPGTATWAKRLTIGIANLTANEQDQYGDFLWLLRYQLSAAASAWEVQLRWGYYDMTDDDYTRGPIVEITNTTWDYVEMGRALIPLRNLRATSTDVYGDSFDASYCVEVWARRTSGAANLDLDCLCPVPVDEGWLKAWAFSIPAGADGWFVFSEGPSGHREVTILNDLNRFSYLPPFAACNFRLPVGDGRFIVVYAGPTSHSISTGISFPAGGTYYERWANLRGAE